MTTLPTISARTAYTQALGLFAVAGGPSGYSSLLDLAQLHGWMPPAWMRDLSTPLAIAAPSVAALWLATLATLATDGRTISRPRWVLVIAMSAALAGVAILDEWTKPEWPEWEALDYAATTMLLAWLVREVLRRHDITLATLGIRLPRTDNGRGFAGMAVGVAMVAVMLLGTQAWLTAALYLPTPVLDQAEALGSPSVAQKVAMFAWTAVAEEMVVTAGVITLLAAARRPVWEWIVLSTLLRILPHLYLGLAPQLGIVVLGMGAAYLYVCYRRLTPLIAAHTLYNLWADDSMVRLGVTTLGQRLIVVFLVMASAHAMLHALMKRQPIQPLSPDTALASRKEAIGG